MFYFCAALCLMFHIFSLSLLMVVLYSVSLFSAFGLSKYSSDSLIVDKSFLTREFSTCTLFRVFFPFFTISADKELLCFCSQQWKIILLVKFGWVGESYCVDFDSDSQTTCGGTNGDRVDLLLMPILIATRRVKKLSIFSVLQWLLLMLWLVIELIVETRMT